MRTLRQLVVIGTAATLAGCRDATGPSGPPNLTVERFAVNGLTYTVTVKNRGGAGDFRLVLWGSTIGNFNGEPAVSSEVCRRGIAPIAAGADATADIACLPDAYAATAQVRDASQATGWRITDCLAFRGECNPDIRPGRPGPR
jgi:hypothetical protein